MRKLLAGSITFLGGLYTVVQAELPLAVVGVFLKAPILIALAGWAHLDLAKYAFLYQTSEGGANHVAQRVLQSAKTVQVVQAHRAERSSVMLYRAKLDKYIDYLHLTHFRQTALCFSAHLVGQFEDLVLMGIGFWLVLERRMTLGEYLTFRAHLNCYSAGWGELRGWWREVTGVVHSAAAYFELMYRRSEIPADDRNALAPPVCRGELAFENVRFAYRSHPSMEVLRGINVRLRPGTVVALVGKSGGGKSTVSRLIQRFYDPTGGHITLDGQDLREYRVSWLRQQVRVVDQEPFLFDLSIKDNIAMGIDPDAWGEETGETGETEEKGGGVKDEVAVGVAAAAAAAKKKSAWQMVRVVEAARLANAHDFITQQCEEGYDTMVGDGGMRLSGGQKQRIAIARALASRPRILVLDEVTAALDADTEARVMAQLFKSMHERELAVLVIAHRLSTIRHVDEINVVEGGVVVEQGNHASLMEEGGTYAALVRASEADTTKADTTKATPG